MEPARKPKFENEVTGAPHALESGTFRAALSSLTGGARAIFSGARAPHEGGPTRSGDDLAVLHGEMVTAITQTCALSETGVVVAGAALGKIVEEAMSQGGLAASETGGSDSPIGEDLKSVDANVRTYIGSLSDLVSDVNGDVRAALGLCREIVVSTQECGAVVRNGRYLTMMMRVEVSRLRNAQNVEFIADEIQSFSDGLEGLLDEVSKVTTSLTDELHELESNCEAVARQGNDDARVFTRALADVEASARAMEGVVYGRSEGEAPNSLSNILRISQDSLSCFQFHDPMAQDLQTVDVLLAECRTAMNARGGSPEVVAPLVYSKRVGDDAPIDPAQASAGELLLF